MAPSSAHAGSATSAGRPPTAIAVALGSNLGDRHAHLTFAVDKLRETLLGVRVSAFLHTRPEGVGSQPMFLNAALIGTTTLAARDVLALLLAIEGERGRVRPYPGAARTLDLDLILYGAEVITEPGLHVPHPRFRERRFVLAPLAEIAPDVRDPVSGLTMVALRDRLPSV